MGPRGASAGARSSTAQPAAQAWSSVERVLQTLAAPGSSLKDWAAAPSGINAIDVLMQSCPPAAMPSWLLPKLAAAVARGLQPQILGMSGSNPPAAVLFKPSSRGSSAHEQLTLVLNTLCGVGELMARLVTALHMVIKGEQRPPFTASPPELLKLFTTDTGLLTSLAAAMGPIGTYLTTHKVLKPQTGGRGAQEAEAFLCVGLADGIINLWCHIRDVLAPSYGLVRATPTVMQDTVQPVLSLCVTLLKAFPGPAAAPLPGGSSTLVFQPGAAAASMSAMVDAERGDAAAAAAAAAVTAAAAGDHGLQEVSHEQLTSRWVYRVKTLSDIVKVAAMLTNAIAVDIWTKALGSPAILLPRDISQTTLQLLGADDAKYMVSFAMLVLIANLHYERSGEGVLDPVCHPAYTCCFTKQTMTPQTFEMFS